MFNEKKSITLITSVKLIQITLKKINKIKKFNLLMKSIVVDLK